MRIEIRQERECDRKIVENVVERAFAGAEHSDGSEHILVSKLRAGSAFVPELSLVAFVGSEIVGHILFTKIRISGVSALALAPLSVAPSWQGKGVGRALIEEGHRVARGLGYGFSVVLGSEGYYSGSGYVPAEKYGIFPPFDVDSKYYMAICLNEVKDFDGGIVRYDDAFGLP